MRLQSFYSRGLRPCDFVQFGLAMYTTNFRPSSPYYEAFNSRVIQFFEAGLLTHLVSNYTASNINKIDKVLAADKFKSDIVKSLEYYAFNARYFSVLFIILTFGYLTSVLSFLGEVVLGRIICPK